MSTELRGVLSVRARVGVTVTWPPLPATRTGGLASLPSDRFTSPAPAGEDGTGSWFGSSTARHARAAAEDSPHALAGPASSCRHKGAAPRLVGVANSSDCRLTRSSSLTNPPPSAAQVQQGRAAGTSTEGAGAAVAAGGAVRRRWAVTPPIPPRHPARAHSSGRGATGCHCSPYTGGRGRITKGGGAAPQGRLGQQPVQSHAGCSASHGRQLVAHCGHVQQLAISGWVACK